MVKKWVNLNENVGKEIESKHFGCKYSESGHRKKFTIDELKFYVDDLSVNEEYFELTVRNSTKIALSVSSLIDSKSEGHFANVQLDLVESIWKQFRQFPIHSKERDTDEAH